MKRLFGCVIALAMILSAAAVTGEETGTAQVVGNIEDGAYVLTVRTDPDDTGEWRADEMAQDDTVVRLAFSGTEEGVFTARYEPTGDGQVSVCLRHYSGFVCDRMHGFDLLVKDGKVQEAVGGFYTASPAEEDQDPYFSGKWLEEDSQFTALLVTKNAAGGWDVEISSPLSHGGYVIRARAYFDCDYDAFVYADGVKYDLIPGTETQERESETGLWGTLRFAGTAEDLQLVWYGMETTGNEEVPFERAADLPL